MKVLRADDFQKKHLAGHADRHFTVGLMDQLVLVFSPEGLKEAHENDLLRAEGDRGEGAPIIRTEKAEDAARG